MEPPFPLLPGPGANCRWWSFACELTRCGYRGPWSLEIFNDGFRASPTGATAKDGYRSLLWLEEQTRRQLADSDAALFSPPALPHYDGLEFIEFAASPAESDALSASASRGMGFTLAGQSAVQSSVALRSNGGAQSDDQLSNRHSWADHFSSASRRLAVRNGATGERPRTGCGAARPASGYATWARRGPGAE